MFSISRINTLKETTTNSSQENNKLYSMILFNNYA